MKSAPPDLCASGGACSTTSGRPGIDQLRTKPFKVAHVARGNGGLACGRDSRDLDIADFNGPTQSAAIGGDSCRGLRSRFVEGNDATFEILLERFAEGLFQQSSPPSGCKKLQPIANFEDGDRRRPDGFRRLRIQPLDHDWIHLPLHECRDHIRVEQDHGSNTAGRTDWPRSSGISSSRPSRWKRAEMRDPSGARAVPSLLTALRRISRTSSSRYCARAGEHGAAACP